MTMSENHNSYDDKLAQEAEFWGRFEADAIQHGIPWWCDLRRATKLSKSISGWMHDPKIEEILRGRSKRRLIAMASEKKGTVLDLGCGSGWLALELARNGMQVDAYDISPDRIAVAKHFLKNNPFKDGFGNVSYEVRDINTINLDKNRYDAVVVWDSLHHILSLEKIMEEISGSLKPYGRLIILDHIGFDLSYPLVRLLKNIFYPVGRRVKKVISSLRSVSDPVLANDDGEKPLSPFEDVTGMEMVDIIKRKFFITDMYTQICISSAAVNNLTNLPYFIKYPLCRLIKFIDDMLIALGLLKGEYVFIAARKTEGKL